MTALLWCDKMHKNKGKKLLHLTIEFFMAFVNTKKCLTARDICAKIFQQSFRWLLHSHRMVNAGGRNSEIVMSTYIKYGSFYHNRERGEFNQ